jgi:hypothetical protein
MTEPRPPARSTRWRWIAAIWLAGALFEASQSVFILHAEGKNQGELKLFLTEFVTWLPWALATPCIVALARRYPLFPSPSVRGIGLHLLVFAAVSAGAEVWSAMLQVQFNPWSNRRWPTFWDTWSTTLIFQALTFVIAYGLILSITYVVDSRADAARQRTEAARLNEALSNARLAALRSQMDPHFMFNTLNSIAGLVRDRRGEAAIGMIVGLSEFLRRASEDSHRSQVSLGEEVEYLQRYLDIQKVRFGDRLQVSLDIPAELLAARVPQLLLQPLVENAIKHGVSQRVSGGLVRVSGERRDGALQLTVFNDGPCSHGDLVGTRAGVGLGNLRTRLQILHGEKARLVLRQAEGGGVETVVTLPLRED